MRQGAAIREAQVFAFNLPPIIGLGTGSGFEYQLLDLEGRDPIELAGVAGGLTVAANQDPRLGPTFTTFSAGSPQLFLDLDRERLQALGVSVRDLFTTLQGTLGQIYVNDFNLFGRTWQVNIQAAEADRASVADINRLHVRNASGEMVPVTAVARVEFVVGPQSIVRYNNYRSVTLNGGPAPGVASGAALAGDGGDQRRDAAARLRLRLDRHRAPGEAGGRPDHDDSRPRPRLRLPVPRRPLRELDDPGAGAALGLRRRRRRSRCR